MGVARHPEVVRAPHVDADLDVVVAEQLREVADQLQLLFVLIERAVAAVDAQARAELEVAGPVVSRSTNPAGRPEVKVLSRFSPRIPASVAGVVPKSNGSTLTLYLKKPNRKSASSVDEKA